MPLIQSVETLDLGEKRMNIVKYGWVMTLVTCLSCGTTAPAQDLDMDDLFGGLDMEEFEDTGEENGEETAVPEVPSEEGEIVNEMEEGEGDDRSAPAEPMPDVEEAPLTEDAMDSEPVMENGETEEQEDASMEPAAGEEQEEAESPDDELFDWDMLGEEEAPAEETQEEAAPVEPAEEDPLDMFGDNFWDEEPAVEEAPVESADEVIEEPVFEDEEVEEAAVEEDDPEEMTEVSEERAREVAEAERVRRQARQVAGLQSLDAAYKQLRAGEYEVARQEFEAALRDIPEIPSNAEVRDQATWGLAEAHYRIAQDLYKEGESLTQAQQQLNRALALSPDHRGVSFLQRRIARAQARQQDIADRPVPVHERADVAEKNRTVEELLREGQAYFDEEEYDQAELLFDSVLLQDDYNTVAMRFLRKIADRKMKVSTTEREATVARMMQDVRDAWNPPRRRDIVLPETVREDQGTDMVTPSRRLQEKMEGLIIPRIEFREANIQDVVAFLRDASEAADVTDGTGVNIILNLDVPGGSSPASRPAAAEEPAEAGDEWDWGLPEAADPVPSFDEPATGGAISRITLNLRRVSLMDAIRYITEVARLSYRIEDNVVVITPAGLAVGPIITRLYPVQPSILDVIAERDEEEADAGGGGEFGEFRGFGEARRPSGRRGDIKEFFVGAGVPFPVGTSITYNPTISQLIVANTSANLERFERVLSQINVVPSQVEIEARFVEVAQDDLRELGLQWILTDNYEFAQRQGGTLGSAQRLQVNASPKGFTSGNRFFSTTESGLSPESTGVTSEPTFIGDILSISSVLTNPEMRVVIHALSQNGNVDLLSAPRVTTRSGVNASIEVVTEIIYPTEFRVTEPTITGASGSTGNAVISPPTVTPDSFEMRRTGVILNVTPTVGPDGYTIDLALAPEVAELTDWLQYGSSFRVPNPENPDAFQDFTFNIPQPVFSSRNVSTSIVIWDGQTVVMGGLMREALVEVNDKIPLLGDIPLLGRLFRVESSQSRKENLLIFVTARLVDPSGKPIQREAVTSDQQ
jgi:general secretion pathway protein D